MWERVRANGVFQFAVGVVVVLLVVNQMTSGSLLLAVNSWINPPPADGATQFIAPSPWLETVFSVLYSLIGGVGVYAIATAEFVYRGIRSFIAKPQQQPSVPQPVAVAQASGSTAQSTDPQQLILDLGRAAFENDLAKLEQVRWLIRMPQAISELAEAYRKGDVDTVAERQMELDANMPKAKKGGA